MFNKIVVRALPLTLILLAGCASNPPSSGSGSTAAASDTVSTQDPGFVALQNGDNATAAADMQQEKAQHPSDPYAALDLGLAYQREGRMDLAEPQYRQAMAEGEHAMPVATTQPWADGMTVAQIACEDMSIGLPPAAPGTARPCQPQATTVAVVDTSTSKRTAFATYFDVDQATLTPAGKQAIDAAAQQAISNPNARIAIVGKASLTGSDEHNMELSERRADTVKNEMIAAGVPESKIDAKWVGDTQPDVSETAGVEEPRNRVVEGRFE
jgi:outer membrane protein OmpA-like peptidoglycan-associated protein